MQGKASKKTSKELGQTVCWKSIKELLKKVYNKGCMKWAVKYPTENGINQAVRHITKQ